MLRELQKRMEELHMVSSGDKVLVGVSGGADSVGLLLGLKALQESIDFSLEAIHVEHGIRGEESVSDAVYVETLCQNHQIPCHKVSVDVPAYCKETGFGTEEAARVLRYRVFEKFALEKGAKVALAHHREDNAETILFHMVRGSSLQGLCGMQPVRQDENGVCYIRPLLFFHRAQIESFLRNAGVEWRTDSTNKDLEYSRNFLRAKVIPDLVEINTRAVEHLNQTAEYLSELKSFLDMETEKVWSEVVKVGEKISLSASALNAHHLVMQRQIAYKAIVHMANRKKDITSTHVEDLLALAKGQSGKKISLPYGIVAWKEFDMVYVAVEEAQSEEVSCGDKVYEVTQELLEKLFEKRSDVDYVEKILIGDAGEVICCRIFERSEESLEIPRKTYTKWLDYDKIRESFCIRTRRSGDYFISDASGHRKKLKNYFIEEKIPMAEREKYWLLVQEHEVLWMIGGRISEHVKVSQETRYIIEITYDGGKSNE